MGGAEQRVPAQVHGGGAGVSVLSGHRHVVPAHRLYAGDDADIAAFRLQNRSLLDMQFEECRQRVIAAALSAPALAQTAAHDHSAAAPHKLTLNQGRKWTTDEPLRAGMGRIRSLVEPRLDAAHAGKLTPAQYRELAAQVETEVGGIVANDSYPADFIRDNLEIQTNVIDAAYRAGTRKLCFLGSSCIYPRLAPQPLQESSLLTGPLEPTNQWYAIAKIAGIKMCQAYALQHGFNAISVMPTNLYGPGDNFDLQTSHVLPALLRKFHAAKESGAKEVTVWGSGTPRREFLYVDDLADALCFLMERYDSPEIINVGCGSDTRARDGRCWPCAPRSRPRATGS